MSSTRRGVGSVEDRKPKKSCTPRLVIGWIWIALDVALLVGAYRSWVASGSPRVSVGVPGFAEATGAGLWVIASVGLVPLWCGLTALFRYDRKSGLYIAIAGGALFLIHLINTLFIYH